MHEGIDEVDNSESLETPAEEEPYTQIQQSVHKKLYATTMK